METATECLEVIFWLRSGVSGTLLADRLHAIGYWHLVRQCRLSVCPSASNVHCGAQYRCRIESCSVMLLAGHFLFSSSDTFDVGCNI